MTHRNASIEQAEIALRAAGRLPQPHRVQVAVLISSVQYKVANYASTAARLGAHWTAANLRSKTRELLRAVDADMQHDQQVRCDWCEQTVYEIDTRVVGDRDTVQFIVCDCCIEKNNERRSA